jgi:hypothetical protein
MAITFPRDMPDELGVVAMAFPPEPMIEVTPLRSGRQISADLGPTLWRARYTSHRMRQDKAGIVRSWYDTLLSLNDFYGYDKLREYPLAYATGWGALTVGGNPFSGSGRLVSVAGNNVQINIDQVPNGFALAPGDYIAFDYASGASRALHRVAAAATANNSGQVTLDVRPHIRPGWAVDAAIMFRRAAARMIILPKSYDERIEARVFTTISFEAIQTL